MKRVISVLAMLALVVSMFVACGSDGSDNNQTSMDIPEWFLNPPQAEDAIYGLGSAKMKDVSRSREAAIARARQDIAFQVNARVEAMIIDYYQEAGVDDNTQAVKFYETISKQIAAIDLSNATTKQVYIAKDGTCYAMVEFSKNKMMDQVGQVFERNEDAAFAEFKADQALQRLDHDLDEEPLQSGAGK
jgi:hypothetical protein